MNASRTRFLRFLSWFSLLVPFIAYSLCFVVFSSPYSWVSWISPYRYSSVVLSRRYAFLVVAAIGVSVFFADLGFKRWRVVWLPLAGLAVAYWLYVRATEFTC